MSGELLVILLGVAAVVDWFTPSARAERARRRRQGRRDWWRPGLLD